MELKIFGVKMLQNNSKFKHHWDGGDNLTKKKYKKTTFSSVRLLSGSFLAKKPIFGSRSLKSSCSVLLSENKQIIYSHKNKMQ